LITSTRGEEGKGREEIVYVGAGTLGEEEDWERREAKERGTAVQPYFSMAGFGVDILVCDGWFREISRDSSGRVTQDEVQESSLITLEYYFKLIFLHAYGERKPSLYLP
jgi:hypothetical protein